MVAQLSILCQLIDRIVSGLRGLNMAVNWLKQRREELRLSQEALASRFQLAGLDISRAAISHWETGRDKMPLNDIKARRAIAASLDLTVAELLYLSGYNVDDEDRTSSDAGRRAALIVDKLPPAAQSVALEQLRALERLVNNG
jgi:transcriptional regulator with XRE-family HTH domain